MKIILDTDLGGDIDDAIALYMLLAEPSVDLLGIGSVYLGNEWRRGLIQEILEVFEAEVPVCLGAEDPLIGRWDNESLRPLRPEREAEGDPRHAAQMIVDLCTEHPDAVILAIGPLTNVALALQLAPWIAQEHKLMIMGGDPGSGRPEWNIFCDPEAARMVYESGITMHAVGLNVTNQCQFTQEDIDQILANDSPRGKVMAKHLSSFLERFHWLPILHDPLAVAALLTPEVLHFEPHHVVVETQGSHTRGTTVDLRYDENSPISLAMHVDAARFTADVRDFLSGV